jgi:hypothetical protein
LSQIDPLRPGRPFTFFFVEIFYIQQPGLFLRSLLIKGAAVSREVGLARSVTVHIRRISTGLERTLGRMIRTQLSAYCTARPDNDTIPHCPLTGPFLMILRRGTSPPAWCFCKE